MLYFDLSTIHDDVLNWEQTPEELEAWTESEMKNELLDIFGTDNGIIHEDGEEISIDDLAKLYTETAHEIAKELKA